MSVSSMTLTVKLTNLDVNNEDELDEVHDLIREYCTYAAARVGAWADVEIASIKGVLLYD